MRKSARTRYAPETGTSSPHLSIMNLHPSSTFRNLIAIAIKRQLLCWGIGTQITTTENADGRGSGPGWRRFESGLPVVRGGPGRLHCRHDDGVYGALLAGAAPPP